MKTFSKLNQPFAFWLAQTFLPGEVHNSAGSKPLNDHDFYGILGIVIFFLIILEIVFHDI